MVFAQVVIAIGFSSVFPFLPLYVESLGSSSGMSINFLTGMVFSGQSLTMMFASPVWGGLADRWGRKMMLVRATFGGAVLLELMAFVTSAEQLVMLRMAQGLVTGVVGASNALVAATVPRAQTGFAMGLMMVGMGTGLGVGPIIGGVLADAYGFRAAFYITGAILLVGGAMVIWGVEERFVPLDRTQTRRPGFLSNWRRILTTPGVAAVYGLRFLNQTGLMTIFPIIPLFVLELIKNPDRANSLTGIIVGTASVSSAACSVFLGRLGDRIGHHMILIVSAMTCALFFFLQSLATSAYQLLAAQVLTGAAMGGIGPSISALLAKFTQHGEEGAVYGLDNSITSGGRALGPLVGVGISALLGLRAVFVAIAIIYLIVASVAAFFIPRPKGKQKNIYE